MFLKLFLLNVVLDILWWQTGTVCQTVFATLSALKLLNVRLSHIYVMSHSSHLLQTSLVQFMARLVHTILHQPWAAKSFTGDVPINVGDSSVNSLVYMLSSTWITALRGRRITSYQWYCCGLSTSTAKLARPCTDGSSLVIRHTNSQL